jgi:hypothetical protein
MNDPAITHIDSVMQIAATAGNEVRAQRRLVILGRQLFQANHCELPQILMVLGTMGRLRYPAISVPAQLGFS